MIVGSPQNSEKVPDIIDYREARREVKLFAS
jgi:hypothetical protein